MLLLVHVFGWSLVLALWCVNEVHKNGVFEGMYGPGLIFVESFALFFFILPMLLPATILGSITALIHRGLLQED